MFSQGVDGLGVRFETYGQLEKALDEDFDLREYQHFLLPVEDKQTSLLERDTPPGSHVTLTNSIFKNITCGDEHEVACSQNGGAGHIEGFEYFHLEGVLADSIHGLRFAAGFKLARLDFVWVKDSTFTNLGFSDIGGGFLLVKYKELLVSGSTFKGNRVIPTGWAHGSAFSVASYGAEELDKEDWGKRVRVVDCDFS